MNFKVFEKIKIKVFLFFAITSCVCLLITVYCGTPSQNMIIRIMTFNLHHCEGVDSVYDVGRIAGFIQECGADIILCQEVDRGYSDRSNYEDQPKILAEMLGFHSFYGANIGETYGNLILSRFPVAGSKNVPLPNPENKEPRGVIVTTISAHGHSFVVLNTHLSAFSALNREKQIEYLVIMIGDMTGPVVFGADFNTKPSTQLKSLLEDCMLVSTRGILGIEEGIDDILVSPDLKECIVDSEIVPTTYSDHPAYRIDIDCAKYKH